MLFSESHVEEVMAQNFKSFWLTKETATLKEIKKKETKTKSVENSRFKSYRKKLYKIDTFYNGAIFIYLYFRKSNLKEANK